MADNKIIQMQDYAGNNQYPVTLASIVYDDNGKTVAERLAALEVLLKMFEWDGEVIKAKASFYSVGQVSASGKGEEGGGGGTAGLMLLTEWDDSITDLSSYALGANLGKGLRDEIAAMKANPASFITLKTINNQSLFGSGNLEVKTTVDWKDVQNKIVNGNEFRFLPSEYTDSVINLNYLTVDNQALTTAVGEYRFFDGTRGYASIRAKAFAVSGGTSSQYLKGDGSLDSNAYLPLSGGTIESAGIPLTIKRTNNSYSVISFYGIADGTSQHFGYLGFSGVGEPIYMTSGGSERILIHSSNIGSYALPLNGGIIGDSWSSGTEIRRKDATNGYASLIFSQADGTILGRFGFGGVDMPILVTQSGAYNPLLHSGNVGDYSVKRTDAIDLSQKNLSAVGYGTTTSGWLMYGPAIAIGHPNGYAMLLQQRTDDNRIYVNRKNPDGIAGDWNTIAFTDSDITGNAATATDADMLDGKHLTDIMNIGFDNTLDLDTLYSASALIARYWVFANSSNISNQPWSNSAAQVWTLPGSYHLQIAKFYNSNDIRLRGLSGAGWTNWQQLAFTDSDITGYSAGLKHSNGTIGAIVNSSGNVTIGSGDLAGTNAKLAVWGNQRIYRGNVTAEYLDISVADVSVYYNAYAPDGYCHQYFQSNGNTRLFINGYSGNIGIGTTSPAYKLDVAGTGRFAGLASFDAGVKIGSTTLDNTNLGLSINTSFYPSVSDSLSLGHSSQRWFSIYARKAYTEEVRIGEATLTWDTASQALKVDKPFYSTSQVSSGAKAVEAKAVITPFALLKYPTASTTTEYTDAQIASQYGLTSEVLDNLARGIYTRVTHKLLTESFVWDYEVYYVGDNKTIILRNGTGSTYNSRNYKFERKTKTNGTIYWTITNA